MFAADKPNHRHSDIYPATSTVAGPNPTGAKKKTQPILGCCLHFYIIVNWNEVIFWKRVMTQAQLSFVLNQTATQIHTHTHTYGIEKSPINLFEKSDSRRLRLVSSRPVRGLLLRQCPTVCSKIKSNFVCFLRLRANTRILTD